MVRQVAISLAFAGAVAVAACAPAPPAPAPAPAEPAVNAPEDIAALNAARAAFMAAYEAGDAEAIGRLYADDAISEPNNQPTLKGREAIVNSLKGMFEQVEVKPTLTPEETRTLGNVGLDRGHYSVTATPKAGAPPTSSEGRYMVVFVKEQDGSWKVLRDIDNALGVTPSGATPETK
ncbi:MAG TPA: SgcJ/EcaC family oxidoreductase [Vicinamibacterales bacterium]|nr:SgcJ/EcaC family oxidoreductase [Vicinamibacterales bacterium]